jgi:serine/threonine protein kinase
MGMSKGTRRIDCFAFEPGRVIGGQYVVTGFLGSGWEGEVYAVTERSIGVQRALKVFYPHRNLRDEAVKFYARKLDRLRHCPILIQYHHSGTYRFQGEICSYLVSELVNGELLADMTIRQKGERFACFEALHIIHQLAGGLEHIHQAREYHGDIHDGNILVRRRGIGFEIKLVDFYKLGKADRSLIREDVIQLIRVLYDILGGQRHYAKLPKPVRYIIAGLRRDLISRRFPTAGQLRRHLETFDWDA